MRKLVRLSVVRTERNHKEAVRLRGRMGDLIRSVKSHLGDDFCGYAVVAWATDGRVTTSISKSPRGPIGIAIVPTFVKDKLECHTTEDFIIDTLYSPQKPEGA